MEERVKSLISKIKNRDVHIGIIGLGYVGLPLVIEFCRSGFSVTGFDVDDAKIILVKEGKSYIKHINPSMIKGCKSFSPTADFSRLSQMDCIIIGVPTPLNRNREPDLSFVLNTTQSIANHLRRDQLIVLEK